MAAIQKKQLDELNALTAAGLLTASPKTSLNGNNVYAFSLTDNGAKFYQSLMTASPAKIRVKGFHSEGFCFGSPVLHEVQCTEPADMMGLRISKAEITYKLSN
jgi:hypothetical protein